jgi:hypothetical protein
MQKSIVFASIVIWSIFLFAFSANAQDLEYINSMYWMGINDIEVQGDYAYCCFDAGLVILDISDINEPSFVSRLYIPGDNSNIAVANQCAYIYGNYDILRIINIASPENPQLIGEIPIDAEVNNIWVDENYVYAAAGSIGMLIIDISNPESPQIISRFDTDGVTESIVVRNDIVYLAERHIYPSSRPFQVVNVIDRYNPGLVGYITNDIGWNNAMVVDGDYAYLANCYTGLIVIDISNGTHPAIVAQYESNAYPWNLIKMGDYLVMDYCFDTLQVIDVSTPDSPYQVSSYDPDGRLSNFAVNDDYLFVAGSGLPILDISDLENITPVAGYETPASTPFAFMVGEYLYAIESYAGINIHDITDPAHPVMINRYDLPGQFYSVYLHDNNLYSLAGTELAEIDVSNPAEPGEPNYYELDRGFFEMSIDEPYICLTSFSSGTCIYEKISSDSLEFIRSFECDNFSFGSVMENRIGYFAQNFMLMIYDLSNPADSVVLASFWPSCGPGKLYYHDGFIYTQLVDGQRSTGLSVIDVTDPSNPVDAGTLFFPEFINHINFDGDLAFFSIYPNELQIYDVADPYNPDFLCKYNTPGNIEEVCKHDDYIYIADNSSLIILHFSPTGIEQVAEIPKQFSLSPNYPNPFNASTTISYRLPTASEVTLDIYDILGRKVQTLYNGHEPAGSHSIVWNADGFSSGMYFYKITAGEFNGSGKMMLIK